MFKLKPISLAIALSSLLVGCVSVPNPDPKDPFESLNRSVYKVNDVVDRSVFQPVAKGYRYIIPSPVRTCVSNIFGNLGDIWSGINSFLQGRGLDGVNTFGRVLLNTTAGIGGCIDVASMNGAKKIPNDFGTTMAVWGIGDGPYMVLPIMGPSNLRDAVSVVGTPFMTEAIYISPWSIDNIPIRNSLVVLEGVDTRYQLLDAKDLVDDIALDQYAFIRDAYMQNRANTIRQKKGPEITDGTKVPRGSAYYDPRMWTDSGGDPFAKPVDLGYNKTTDDASAGSNVPNYDDPNVPNYDDPDAGNASDSGVPQYDDPDAPANTSDPSVPQYDDPDAPNSSDSGASQSKSSQTSDNTLSVSPQLQQTGLKHIDPKVFKQIDLHEFTPVVPTGNSQ